MFLGQSRPQQSVVIPVLQPAVSPVPVTPQELPPVDPIEQQHVQSLQQAHTHYINYLQNISQKYQPIINYIQLLNQEIERHFSLHREKEAQLVKDEYDAKRRIEVEERQKIADISQAKEVFASTNAQVNPVMSNIAGRMHGNENMNNASAVAVPSMNAKIAQVMGPTVPNEPVIPVGTPVQETSTLQQNYVAPVQQHNVSASQAEYVSAIPNAVTPIIGQPINPVVASFAQSATDNTGEEFYGTNTINSPIPDAPAQEDDDDDNNVTYTQANLKIKTEAPPVEKQKTCDKINNRIVAHYSYFLTQVADEYAQLIGKMTLHKSELVCALATKRVIIDDTHWQIQYPASAELLIQKDFVDKFTNCIHELVRSDIFVSFVKVDENMLGDTPEALCHQFYDKVLQQCREHIIGATGFGSLISQLNLNVAQARLILVESAQQQKQ